MGTMYGCATMSKRMIQQKGETGSHAAFCRFDRRVSHEVGTDKICLGNRSGCIINISSLLAIKGGRGASAYAASKAGIIGKS